MFTKIIDNQLDSVTWLDSTHSMLVDPVPSQRLSRINLLFTSTEGESGIDVEMDDGCNDPAPQRRVSTRVLTTGGSQQVVPSSQIAPRVPVRDRWYYDPVVPLIQEQ